jgi:hypothetical protein
MSFDSFDWLQIRHPQKKLAPRAIFLEPERYLNLPMYDTIRYYYGTLCTSTF